MSGCTESNITGFTDLLHFFNGRFEVFARVKLFRIFGKELANRTGDSHTAVGIDVDFADAGFNAANDFFNRNAVGLGNSAAVSVNQILQFLRNRG